MSGVNAFRGPWTIAVYTWREGLRKKTLIGFLILSLLVIFGSNFMGSFLNQSTVGSEELDVNLKLVKDICVSTISIFGVLITIFISAAAVPNETENKVIYSILSKPISRFQYLLGKFIGIQFIVIINLALMGLLFFMALWFQQGTLPTLLLWSILLTYFEFLIVSAFTFAISCAATSSVLPTIGGFFIYLTGNLTEYLNDVKIRSSESEEFLDVIIGQTASVLSSILPNLQNFSLKQDILNLQLNDPPSDMQFTRLLIYGITYAVSGFIIAVWVFRRREL